MNNEDHLNTTRTMTRNVQKVRPPIAKPPFSDFRNLRKDEKKTRLTRRGHIRGRGIDWRQRGAVPGTAGPVRRSRRRSLPAPSAGKWIRLPPTTLLPYSPAIGEIL